MTDITVRVGVQRLKAHINSVGDLLLRETVEVPVHSKRRARAIICNPARRISPSKVVRMSEKCEIQIRAVKLGDVASVCRK